MFSGFASKLLSLQTATSIPSPASPKSSGVKYKGKQEQQIKATQFSQGLDVARGKLHRHSVTLF